MRLLAALLLFALVGCHGPTSETRPDPLAPEWPEFDELNTAEPDAPEWVETALDAEPREGLVETESSVFLSTYQNTLSRVDGPTCRFQPTCSEFARRAVSQYGLTGIILTFGRLQRAHTHDRERYGAEGRRVVDNVDDHTFWFDPAGEPRWKWHQRVEFNR